MSNWPPDPNKKPDQSNQSHQNDQNQANSNQANFQFSPHDPKAWSLIEKILMVNVIEQRRARRWNIFFKCLGFGYVILLLVIMGRGCSPTGQTSNLLEGQDGNSPHLAVVDVKGVISSSDEANAEVVNQALTRAFENEHSKAVALNINSPGGSPVQSDEIWQHMMQLRKDHPNKKLYAVIGDIGASGAYYIASGADEIWVNPSSLVGSIGVIMQSYNIEGLLDKVGVRDRTITSGEYKDILSMSRPLTEYEKQHVQSVLDNTHKHFIDAVKEGRGDRLKDPEKNQIFTGLFWTGEQSIQLGLADKSGGILALKKSLDLKNTVNYTPVDPLREVFDRFAVKMGNGIGSSVKLNWVDQDQQTNLR